MLIWAESEASGVMLNPGRLCGTVKFVRFSSKPMGLSVVVTRGKDALKYVVSPFVEIFQPTSLRSAPNKTVCSKSPNMVLVSTLAPQEKI